jgi:hypothetical protein
LLGGTSGKVSRNSKIPVLVVREILKFPRYFSRIQREEKVSTDAVSGGEGVKSRDSKSRKLYQENTLENENLKGKSCMQSTARKMQKAKPSQGLKSQKVLELRSMPYTLPASLAVLLSCPKVTTGKSEKKDAKPFHR